MVGLIAYSGFCIEVLVSEGKLTSTGLSEPVIADAFVLNWVVDWVDFVVFQPLTSDGTTASPNAGVELLPALVGSERTRILKVRLAFAHFD
jgi:hypothetical protein